jgi:hypothetical protein
MVEDFRVEGLHIDDAVVQGTALPASIVNVSISQLDIRDANLSQVHFDATTVVTLITSLGTKVSVTLPYPSLVQDATYSTLISDPLPIKEYLDRLGRNARQEEEREPGVSVNRVREHELYRLLERVCRVRQYWIRDDSDDRAAKLLRDEAWPELIELLRKHDLVREERRGAAGKPSTFYHVKKTGEILARDEGDEQVKSFLEDIDRRIREGAWGWPSAVWQARGTRH